jgi:hypothetical protein
MKPTSVKKRQFKKGNRVKCDLFGRGTVLGLSTFEHHKNCPVIVQFDGHGEQVCYCSTDGDFLPNDPKTKITHL